MCLVAEHVFSVLSLSAWLHGDGLQADLSILDEIDSGLDIDALREVATAVNGLRKPDTATLMVTHYQVRICIKQSTDCRMLCKGNKFDCGSSLVCYGNLSSAWGELLRDYDCCVLTNVNV